MVKKIKILLRTRILFASCSSLLPLLQNSFYIALPSFAFPPTSLHAPFYSSLPHSSYEFNHFFLWYKKIMLKNIYRCTSINIDVDSSVDMSRNRDHLPLLTFFLSVLSCVTILHYLFHCPSQMYCSHEKGHLRKHTKSPLLLCQNIFPWELKFPSPIEKVSICKIATVPLL